MIYRCVEGQNEDSYGYNHRNGTWRGVISEDGAIFEHVNLAGKQALLAVEHAKQFPPMSGKLTESADLLSLPVAKSTDALHMVVGQSECPHCAGPVPPGRTYCSPNCADAEVVCLDELGKYKKHG